MWIKCTQIIHMCMKFVDKKGQIHGTIRTAGDLGANPAESSRTALIDGTCSQRLAAPRKATFPFRHHSRARRTDIARQGVDCKTLHSFSGRRRTRYCKEKTQDRNQKPQHRTCPKFSSCSGNASDGNGHEFFPAGSQGCEKNSRFVTKYRAKKRRRQPRL